MKPLFCAHQDLPSTDELGMSPQLATLALLQASLCVSGQVLDIQHPELDSPSYMESDPDTDDLLAQLIIDRCRELSELVTYYRRLLDPERSSIRPFNPDFPF